MRHETILKRLNEILQEKNGKKARKKLIKLVEKLSAYLQKQEEKNKKYGESVQHLMDWYVKLWKGTPPEKLGRVNWQDMVGKILKDLVVIYEQNTLSIDDIKRDYETFLKVARWLRGDGSIRRFKTLLPTLKQFKTH